MKRIIYLLCITLAVPILQAQRTTDEETVIRVARSATPTVVSLSRRGGSGSGVIVRSDGIIITNAHVVGSARTVEVHTADGRDFTGTVLGMDQTVDTAIVQVRATNLPAAPLGDSDRLEVVTRGVVSATNRDPAGVGIATGLIQTDAAINPGNSGGPLLDSSGRVIGINTATYSGTTGLGFAVPINVATDVMQQILTTGRVRRTYLGIDYRDITPEVARYFRLPVEEGIVVVQVVRGSPAQRAGIQVEDFIVGFDGEAVEDGGKLRRLLRAKRPGDAVRLEIVRGTARRTISVQLGEV
jgi:serine protease DegQ